MRENKRMLRVRRKKTIGEKGMYKNHPQDGLKHLDFMVLDIICLRAGFRHGLFP